MRLYDVTAPKKAANVSINADLLREARGLGINLSRTFEQSLAETVRERRSQQWKEANREALEAYNRFVDSHGVYSDGLRLF